MLNRTDNLHDCIGGVGDLTILTDSPTGKKANQNTHHNGAQQKKNKLEVIFTSHTLLPFVCYQR